MIECIRRGGRRCERRRCPCHAGELNVIFHPASSYHFSMESATYESNARRGRRRRESMPGQVILYEKRIKINISGNEVYYMHSSIFLVKNMMCSRLHCQKGLNVSLFSYKIFPSSPRCMPLLFFLKKTQIRARLSTAA